MFNVIVICLGGLFSRLGQSVVLPYMMLIMHLKKGVPVYLVGIVIGFSYFCNAVGGMLLNYFSNKNSFTVLKQSLCAYILLFILLYYVSAKIENLWLFTGLFFLINGGLGICRALIETLGQIIISYCSTKSGNNKFNFNLRYLCINVGAFSGPIIASWLHVLNNIEAFMFMALALVLYLGLLFLNKTEPINLTASNKGVLSLLALGWADLKFRYFILSSIIIYFGFTQMEVMFAFLVQMVTHNSHVFVVMYMVNTGIVVCFQLPFIKLLERVDIHVSILTGCILIALGLFLISIARTAWGFYFGEMVFTFGEISSISLIGLYIDVNFKDNKEVYYGLSNLTILGRILGAVFSGAVLHFMGPHITLLSCSIVVLFAIYTIYKAKAVPISL